MKHRKTRWYSSYIQWNGPDIPTFPILLSEFAINVNHTKNLYLVEHLPHTAQMLIIIIIIIICIIPKHYKREEKAGLSKPKRLVDQTWRIGDNIFRTKRLKHA